MGIPFQYLIIFICLLNLGFKYPTKITLVSSAENLSELLKRKAEIDKKFKITAKSNNNKLLIFVKVKGKNSLKRVVNRKFPGEVEYTYNILKNESNHIVQIVEIPYSESGDWDISYNHYFASDGKLIAFERRTGFFNSECTNDAAHEIIIYYYDQYFRQIKKVYKLTDSKGKNLVKSKCVFNYDFTDYKIYKTVAACLKGYKIDRRVLPSF